MEEATGEIARWLEQPNVWIPLPGKDHMTYLNRALLDVSRDSRVVMDAHLAALALEHGLTVYSADNDFARFNGLKWVNPLKNI